MNAQDRTLRGRYKMLPHAAEEVFADHTWVERQKRSHGGAYKRIVPDTEQGMTMAAESTKDDGKPVRWEGLV